jgi:hypothetical protein
LDTQLLGQGKRISSYQEEGPVVIKIVDKKNEKEEE